MDGGAPLHLLLPSPTPGTYPRRVPSTYYPTAVLWLLPPFQETSSKNQNTERSHVPRQQTRSGLSGRCPPCARQARPLAGESQGARNAARFPAGPRTRAAAATSQRSLGACPGKGLLPARRPTLVVGLRCLRHVDGELAAEGVHAHHARVRRRVAQGGDLVVVAGHTVQRLGDVSCSLQDDLLGREGSAWSASSSHGTLGSTAPQPCPTRPNDGAVFPHPLVLDGDKRIL